MPIAEGTRLGAYEVQEFVGRGAMGVVYKAWHEALARPAAVKVLQALAPDADASGRFRREAQSIAQMRNPNILNVFDFGEFEGVPYMIVEYVPGGSLSDRLKAGEMLDPEASVRVLRGLASALDYAHSLGVVHRDVKPANVLMGRDEAPILADFGLAKLLQSTSMKSATGVTTGTPAYMAPEQVTGSAVGPAADRYALAAVAYELLTGAPPFSGEGVLELLYAHVHRDPEPPTQRNPKLPAAVDAVVLHGLAKQPEARWASCKEMVDALEKALAGEAVAPPAAPLATPARAAAPAVEATMVMAPGTRAAEVSAPATRRRVPRWLLGAAALLALVVVAGIVVVLLSAAKPTLALSAGTVNAGGSVRLTAHHLPANQQGTIAIASAPQELQRFQASANGDLVADVRIPADLSGHHDLELCWDGSCRASAAVTVLAERRAAATPTPTPTPVRTFTPTIVVSSTSPKLGSMLRVDGHGFDPAREYSLGVNQGGKETPLQNLSPVTPNGTFTANVTVPATLQPGNAELIACIVTQGQVPKVDDCTHEQVQLQK